MEEGDRWLVRLSLLCSVRVTWAYSYLRVLLPYAFLKEDSEAQEYLQGHLGQQKASRVDQLRLTG